MSNIVRINGGSAVANRTKITTVPSQRGTLTYNGNSQSPSWNNYDSSKMAISVDSQINAGTYTAKFIPLSGYCWEDGSITEKSVSWKIGKAAGSLSLSESSITLDNNNPSGSFTVNYVGDGYINVESDNPNVEVSLIDDSTVAVNCINGLLGYAAITVSVVNCTNYTTPYSQQVMVDYHFIPTASKSATSGVTYIDGLDGLSATDISSFAESISNNISISNTTSVVYIDAGPIHRKISVGDQITLALNNTDYVFTIIGFNHDTLLDSSDYGTPTTTGKAGITFQMQDCFATSYKMNDTDTNVGGWDSSLMRTSTMPLMKSYLPAEWQYVIKSVVKKNQRR